MNGRGYFVSVLCLFVGSFIMSFWLSAVEARLENLQHDVAIVGRAVIQLQNQEIGALREKSVDLQAVLEKNARADEVFYVKMNATQPEIPDQECCWGNRGYVVGEAS